MSWLITTAIITFQLMISSSTTVYYVLPDNSTNTTCPSQHCARLSQYLQDNSTLSFVSDVEFYFLPGEHQVTSNIVISHVNNFLFTGITNNGSSPVLICKPQVLLFVLYSHNVTISELYFNKCGGNVATITLQYITSDHYDISACLFLFLCSDCKIRNVNIFHLAEYGIAGINVVGNSQLENITVSIHSKILSLFCTKGILLVYLNSHAHSNYNSTISITELLIIDNDPNNFCTMVGGGLEIELKQSQYHVRVILSRSSFNNLKFAEKELLNILAISHTISSVVIKHCTFQLNIYKQRNDPLKALIGITMNRINVSLMIKGCLFQANNIMSSIIDLTILETSPSDQHGYPSTVTIIKCGFVSNRSPLLHFITEFSHPYKHAVEVFIKDVHFHGNVRVGVINGNMIFVYNMVVHLSGEVVFARSALFNTVVHFDSCDIHFYNNITFEDNECDEIITMKSSSRSSDSSIKIMKFAIVKFVQNVCTNQLITIIMNDYNKIYPFCLFQYIGSGNVSNFPLTKLPYKVIFTNNIQRKVSLRSNSTINYYTYYCRWLTSSSFKGYTTNDINKYIIEVKYPISQHLLLNRHNRICSCYDNGLHNCSNNILGSVSPGQTLQVDLCVPYNPTVTVLYAETHHSLIQDVTCKVVYQAQLTNVIDHYHRKFNFTISSVSNARCQLFLTAEPDLYKYYDVFTIELLLCPLGFVLQNGVCDCDPVLASKEFYITCNIEKATVKRPANSWMCGEKHVVGDNHSSYIICSTCPKDYCDPDSSDISLTNPDLQCQFKRSGILCSQCQHGLSMVFGSSRCMKCTNVHILITLIIIVAGIVLVVLLYLLNLTVTNGTINGIIFYTNIVSINDSVFLVNDNVFKPLKVFISFINLDMGIETCFYNGMESYAKM